MRSNRIYFNNIGQLRILNRLNEIQRSSKNKYNSKNKRSKVILLEKTSPNHYPVCVKFVKKVNEEHSKSPEKSIRSYISREPNNFSFVGDIRKKRNSIITEISNSKVNINNIPSDIYSSNYKKNNKNDNDINQLKKSL